KEFRAVFLVGLEAGVLPGYRARTPQEFEEERRICYVGMSRAQERLYLSGCGQRLGWERQPSPFWHALTPLFS
ncbi:MAG: 3'-5' exonuclease, partial [Ardenticatenaceae bacterium]